MSERTLCKHDSIDLASKLKSIKKKNKLHLRDDITEVSFECLFGGPQK